LAGGSQGWEMPEAGVLREAEICSGKISIEDGRRRRRRRRRRMMMMMIEN